jgi:hypothetical protein
MTESMPALHRWLLCAQLEMADKPCGRDEDAELLGSEWVWLSELERSLHALNDSGHDWVPVVRFLNGVERPIYPETFEHAVYRIGTCVRVQTPLKLAWALTVR